MNILKYLVCVFFFKESSCVVLSEEAISNLEALLVEGDLLEIDLSEKEVVRDVLRHCRPDVYNLFVFEPLVSKSASLWSLFSVWGYLTDWCG